jgi:hypothetical protein
MKVRNHGMSAGLAAEGHARSRWYLWAMRMTGLMALIWFLVRVVPRPSRARYPCQRLALPVASGFVAWLVAGAAGLGIVRRARRSPTRTGAVLCTVLLIVGAGVLLATVGRAQQGPGRRVPRVPQEANQPLGVGRGIHPGRVVWVHDPAATDWAGPGSGDMWYDHINQPVVDAMLSDALQALAGEDTDGAAWDALLRHFNKRRGKGDVGYQAGEKVAIKVNYVLANESRPNRMRKPWMYLDNVDNSPQMCIALLKQLVTVVGAAPADITIGDPQQIMVNSHYSLMSAVPQLKDIAYLTRYGYPGSGRTLSKFSDVPMHWSDPVRSNVETAAKKDFLPSQFAEADYLVNFAVLKSHDYAGVTLCGKNHFGSMIRAPVQDGYYYMHQALATETPGMGHYRCLVDLMGHPQLGGKTVLFLVDGLIGGQGWAAAPTKWQMEPFNGDWPNSIFASQDPVAIDSVGFDFLLNEWGESFPGMDGADDYLHEASQADAAPSGAVYDPDGDGTPLPSQGTHEHWNNAVDKQYSRDLGRDEGIDLVRVSRLAQAAPGS